jgi:hypothetical protein
MHMTESLNPFEADVNLHEKNRLYRVYSYKIKFYMIIHRVDSLNAVDEVTASTH